jgi:hypothetical protein
MTTSQITHGTPKTPRIITGIRMLAIEYVTPGYVDYGYIESRKANLTTAVEPVNP